MHAGLFFLHNLYTNTCNSFVAVNILRVYCSTLIQRNNLDQHNNVRFNCAFIYPLGIATLLITSEFFVYEPPS